MRTCRNCSKRHKCPEYLWIDKTHEQIAEEGFDQLFSLIALQCNRYQKQKKSNAKQIIQNFIKGLGI